MFIMHYTVYCKQCHAIRHICRCVCLCVLCAEMIALVRAELTISLRCWSGVSLESVCELAKWKNQEWFSSGHRTSPLAQWRTHVVGHWERCGLLVLVLFKQAGERSDRQLSDLIHFTDDSNDHIPQIDQWNIYLPLAKAYLICGLLKRKNNHFRLIIINTFIT